MKTFSNALTNLFVYHWKRNNWLFYPPRLFRDFSKVEIDRPIFLIGDQGGGLTLIGRMLRRHDQVISISGNKKYWAGADEMQRVMMCRLPDSLRLGGPYFCMEFLDQRLTPPRSWSYACDELLDLYRKTEADYDQEIEQILRFIIGEALHRYGKGQQGLRFVDKSQVFTVKVSYVAELLKDTNPYFVLITRNPYAACYRAALGKASDMKRYAAFLSLSERVELCAQHWANAMGCALEDKGKVAHFKVMRFEDFLNEPKDSLAELCSFLDLTYDDDMLPRAHHKVPFGSKYRDRWYPIRPDVNNQYLEDIPQRYIDKIAERCQPLAEGFGYSKPQIRNG